MAVSLLLLLSGCKVGPNYARPNVPVPPSHRADGTPPDSQTPPERTFGDLKWFELFQDEMLQQFIRAALKENYDVRIAAQRILAARAYVTVEKAPLYPSAGLAASAERQNGGTQAGDTSFAGGSVIWELDLFGRIRRSTEAARAEYLALEAVRQGVLQTLVAGVAGSYFQMLELDQELSVARKFLESRKDSLRLVQARLAGGLATQMEADQAASLVIAAESMIVDAQRRHEQTENYLNLLLGRLPGPIAHTASLTEQKIIPQVPAGLPSSLLERRPDIRQAEQQLVAANARVGVAKSMFFPSLSLTGSVGYQTYQSSNLFQKNGVVSGYGGSLTAPIFHAGALWANYKASKAQREAAVLSYQKSVQEAFREVADSLIGYQKAMEYRNQRALYAATLRSQLRLADMRYRGGVSSYLEVLDTERQALDAELSFSQAYLAELNSLVYLYKALGGGWLP